MAAAQGLATDTEEISEEIEFETADESSEHEEPETVDEKHAA